MRVQGAIRFILLSEIVFPILLLILAVLLGALQALARAGIIRADGYLGLSYYQGLTLHGTIAAIVFTTFFIVGFSNVVMTYLLGRPLRTGVQWVSWLLMVGGTLMAAWAMLTGRATVLYTFYAPLTAHWSFYVGVVLLVVGSLVPFFFDWIPNYLAWRREHANQPMPLGVQGVLVTFILWFVMILPVASDIMFQLLPLSLGWVDEVNVLLSRTLFWFFGHPLVYFWLLPAYIMLYLALPKLVGGKLYSEPAARLAFLLFLVFSVPVGLHHQFTEGGLTAGWKLWHAFLTFMVAVPSFITAFTVAASLEYGARQRGGQGLFGWWSKLPFASKQGDQWLVAYFMAGLILFLFGGITGIVNASYNLNMAVHNTSWIVGHFHTTVGGLVALSFLGMSLYLVAKLRGTEVGCKPLALATPYFWLAGFLLFEVAMSIAGFYGFPRRTNAGLTYLNPESPLYRPEWVVYAHLSALGGLLAAFGFLLYLIAFVRTLFGRAVSAPVAEFPVAEALHSEPVPLFANLRPWMAAMVLLVVFSYSFPLYDAMKRGVQAKSPAYQHNLPIPIRQLEQMQQGQLPR
jgi:cytochrome c oxidase subunit 1